MNGKETDEMSHYLLVIKKYYDLYYSEIEYRDWYEYATEEEMEYFHQRVEEKYKSVMEVSS